jgi:hypothetical protein
MKRCLALLVCGTLGPLLARADGDLSPSQIETMEKRGLITPAFETAARQWIDARESAAQAKTDEARLAASLPELQKEVADEDAKVARLRNELEHYDHPDETDFTALQQAMKDPNARPDGQLARAQAYVWTYPESPHLTEAEKDLQQVQKQIADRQQAASNAAAAATAAQLRLLQRVKARDLSLGEWRAFLDDKSQTEVTQYLGAPSGQDNEDHWIYQGAWTVDPATNQKAGLQLTFNGGRVQNVAPAPMPAPAAAPASVQ